MPFSQLQINCCYKNYRAYSSKLYHFMIKRPLEPGAECEPRMSPKKSLNSDITKLQIPRATSQSPSFFDGQRIIQRYREARENQHQILAGINLSHDMKRYLFGFSEQHYMTDPAKYSEMIIYNHPLDGLFLMAKQKYDLFQHQKYQERQLKNLKPFSSLSDSNQKAKNIGMVSASQFNEKKQMQAEQGNSIVRNRSHST